MVGHKSLLRPLLTLINFDILPGKISTLTSHNPSHRDPASCLKILELDQFQFSLFYVFWITNKQAKLIINIEIFQENIFFFGGWGGWLLLTCNYREIEILLPLIHPNTISLQLPIYYITCSMVSLTVSRTRYI